MSSWTLAIIIALALSCGSKPPRPVRPPPVVSNDTLPACRVVGTTPKIVTDTAELALAALQEDTTIRIPPLSFEPDRPGSITLRLIEDALRGETDAGGCLIGGRSAIGPTTVIELDGDEPQKDERPLDVWSVRGVCQAQANEIRCSRSAVELLVIQDLSGSISPTLLYIFAHELAHIALGHSRGAAADSFPGSSEASPALVERAMQACDGDDAMRKRESEADRLALSAFSRLVESHRESDDTSYQDLFQGVRTLYSWLKWTPGQLVGERERGHRLCDVLRAGERNVVFPLYRGGHPRWAARTARVVEASSQSGQFFAHDIDYFKRNEALDEEWVETFCRDARALQAGRLVCPAGEAHPRPAASTQGWPISEDSFDLAKAEQLSNERDYEAAARQYDLGCLAMNADACRRAGTLYRTGAAGRASFLSDPDVWSARRSFARGCSLNHGLSCHEQAILAYELMNVPRLHSLPLFERACRLGHSDSCKFAEDLAAVLLVFENDSGMKFRLPPRPSLAQQAASE